MSVEKLNFAWNFQVGCPWFPRTRARPPRERAVCKSSWDSKDFSAVVRERAGEHSSVVVRERAHGTALASACFFVAFSCISGISERLSKSASRRERNVIVGCKWHSLSFQTEKITVFVAFSCRSGISEQLGLKTFAFHPFAQKIYLMGS